MNAVETRPGGINMYTYMGGGPFVLTQGDRKRGDAVVRRALQIPEDVDLDTVDVFEELRKFPKEPTWDIRTVDGEIVLVALDPSTGEEMGPQPDFDAFHNPPPPE